MTWAGWMRAWARRVAMRRISWTDQRMRAGVPGFRVPGSCVPGSVSRVSGAGVSGAGAAVFLWGGLVYVMAYAGHHGEGEHDERYMPVPAAPGAGLIVVQAQFGLGGLEAVLDGPAAALDLDQLGCARAGRAPRGEDRRLAVGQAAPEQQAAGPGAAQRLVELGRIKVGQLQVGPIVEPCALGALAG